MGNNRIRLISSTGVVTTFAGSSAGYNDGTGTVAQFYNPFSVLVSTTGILYVADSLNNVVRMISSTGVVTTLAGSYLSAGASDGVGTAAQFNRPWGLALDIAGTLYVSEWSGQKIRAISATGTVKTLVGAGASFAGLMDGTGTAVRFNAPAGMWLTTSGVMYVCDYNNNAIRAISLPGIQGVSVPVSTSAPTVAPSTSPTPAPTPGLSRAPSPAPTAAPTAPTLAPSSSADSRGLSGTALCPIGWCCTNSNTKTSCAGSLNLGAAVYSGGNSHAHILPIKQHLNKTVFSRRKVCQLSSISIKIHKIHKP